MDIQKNTRYKKDCLGLFKRSEMGLKVFTTDFADLGKEKTFRQDVGFHYFQNNSLVQGYYYFNNLFEIQKNNKVDIENINNDFFYAEISNVSNEGDVSPVMLNFDEAEEEDLRYFKKIEKGDIIQAKEGDILLSKVRPNLKKYILINHENSKYFYTSAFIHLKPKKLNKILYYSLRTIFYEHLIAISRRGKGYPTLKEDDFLYLKFDKSIIDNLEKNNNLITSQIEEIENRIKKLKSQMRAPQKIINEVFAREFEFDENQLFEFGKGMTAGTQIAPSKKLRVFKTDFENLARSSTLRFSTRFHNPPMKKLMDFLDSMETLQVKDVVESYEQGIQPEYNADGKIPVVKIANLKNNFIDFTESEYITEEYYNNLNEIKKLKKGDIIICATGKISLGKIDYYDYKHDSITTVDNYILRLNENYNPLFFTYFFRSILGCFQVERDYTGATNQIHLYWDQISNFKIPDIPLERQEEIVDEIKKELDDQEKMKSEIEENRDKVDEIIKHYTFNLH
ncbi:hypothetical protein O6B32_08030 [Campylobacter ureolyticus]|uniref:Restriction endonuclease subunit S n=2 Tax=Campylobacter ureolyticus TaxID=827 RepID=A0A9Q4KLZ8_9BACT|nr:hypothetical protein [Campylobacter ureolyticus]MCZ6164131.1 hypothetical protein [Campylobacter ureolyticus]MCZ6167737.1 hypothetical protein [Campylobacter ureolyticus]